MSQSMGTPIGKIEEGESDYGQSKENGRGVRYRDISLL